MSKVVNKQIKSKDQLAPLTNEWRELPITVALNSSITTGGWDYINKSIIQINITTGQIIDIEQK